MNGMLGSNASTNDALSVSPMLLPVNWMRFKRIDAICVSFHLSLQHKSSSVSVVFDFNASLNDVAPASLILLSVDLMKMKKKSKLLMDAICMLLLLSSQLR